MTLAEIELDIFRRLDYADVPPASVKARIDGFINQRHRQILSHDRLRALRQQHTYITLEAGINTYGLPFGARVHRVYDDSNDFELSARTVEWYREHNPGGRATPEYWIPYGISAQTMPLGGNELWMVALEGSPGTAITYTLILLGTDDRDEQTQPSQQLTLHPVLNADPLVRQPITIPDDFFVDSVISFRSSKPVANVVALYNGLVPITSRIVAQIPVGKTASRYVRICLFPTPAASLQKLMVDYELEIPPLVDPEQVPWLPEDFHDLLCMYGRLDEYEFKSDDRWQALMIQIQARLKELRMFVDNHDIYKQHAVPEGNGRSRLGPYFPAGT